jgi:hypothetical protein
MTPNTTRRPFLLSWTAGIFTAYALAGGLLYALIHNNKRSADLRHEARMNPDAPDPGVTAADTDLPDGASPLPVTAGIYVDRISELSVPESSWTAEFYVWFRWSGADVGIGELFDVIDGSIESRSLQDAIVMGDDHYVRYRVLARITKAFDTSRFPCDDHLLTIGLESPKHTREQLLFFPDVSSSSVSSRIRVPGYDVTGSVILEKPHSYRSTKGDPRVPADVRITRSQLRMGLSIGRPGPGLYYKLFQSLFIAIGIALLAAFIRPTDLDPRFGLGIGALFAAVANSYVTASLTPQTDVASLADIVNGLGAFTILLTLIQSTISLQIHERRGDADLSRRFDRLSFWVILGSYFAVNAAILLAAA